MANPFDQFDAAEPVTPATPAPAAPTEPGGRFQPKNPFDQFDPPAPADAPKEDLLGQAGAGLVTGIPNAAADIMSAAEVGEKALPFRTGNAFLDIPMTVGTGMGLMLVKPLLGKEQQEAIAEPVRGEGFKQALSSVHLNPEDYFRPPATPGERIARLGGEGAITSVFSPNKAAGWGKIIQLGKEFLIGGASGAAAAGAMEVAPDEFKPLAGLAGGLVGGVGSSALVDLPGAGMRAAKGAGDYMAPAFAGRSGRERLAGKQLGEIVGDTDQTINALGNAEELVPGSKPTSFQATGNVGIGTLERALARGDDEFKRALLDRQAQQNEARVAALDAVQESGNPAMVADFFRTRMRDLEAHADELYDVAESKAKGAYEGLGERPAGEIGDQARSAIEANFKRMNGEANRLWNSIDPDGTMNVLTKPLVNNTARIYGTMSPEEMLSLSAAEKDIAAIIGGYGDTIPFQRFKDLRSQISEAMRDAKMTGKNRAYGRLSQLRGAVEDAVTDSIAGKMEADPSLAEQFVRRARDWYTGNVEREAGVGAAARPVAAAAGAARGVPEGRGAAGLEGGAAARVAGDQGLSEDAVARRAVEGRFEQGAREYPIAPRDEWYGEANYETAGGRMTEMTPDEFLARARPLEMDEVARDNIDDLKRHIQAGRTLDPLKFFDGGKEDGRHRAIAAKELGIERVPVIEFGDQRGSSFEQAAKATQTSTPEFKRWFGDSKVVDENGAPLRVYHGTNQDFDQFKTQTSGTTTVMGIPVSVLRNGSFFAEDPTFANTFAKSQRYGLDKRGSANVMPAYLSLKNPLVVNAEEGYRGPTGWRTALPPEAIDALAEQGFDRKWLEDAGDPKDFWEAFDDDLGAEFVDGLKKAGYDGVKMTELDDAGKPTSVYVAFEPTQIKSAIGNRGTFDPNDPNILHQSAAPSLERQEAFRRYMSQRTFKTREEAENALRHYIDKWNEPGMLGNKPEQLSYDLIDDILVRRGNGVGISQKGMKPRAEFNASSEPIGDAPEAAWGAQDMQDYRKEAKPGEVVDEQYVSLDSIPKAKLAGGKTGYDWSELERGGAIPPVTLRRNKNGTVSIIDGNHRIEFFRERGYDSVPAYVIRDANAPGTGELFQSEAAPIASTMSKRFAEAGRPEPEARAAGELVDAFYTTMAKRLGTTVEQVQEQFPLPKVQKGGSAAGFKQGAQATDTPAFRKWFGSSKVVDAEGKPLVVYHGSPARGIEAFDPTKMNDKTRGTGFWFTAQDKAGTYSGPNGEVYPVYLKMERPIIVQWDGHWADGPGNAFPEFRIRDSSGVLARGYFDTEAQARAYADRLGMKDYDIEETPVSGGQTTDEWVRRLRRDNPDADGIILRNVAGGGDFAGGFAGMVEGDEFVVFDPAQAKSVNNRGTFDASDPRMMYQGRKPKAEATRDLYAVHNIKPGGVLNAAKIGGLPMPSMAVAHIGKGDFGNFGDISLVGSPRMIDPKGGTGARTYDADVYSPRYPSITYDIDTKAFNAINKPIVEGIKEYGGQEYDGIDVNRIENRGPNDAIDSPGLKLAYLKETGKAPKVIRSADGKVDRYTNREAIDAAVAQDHAGYEAWAADKLAPLVKRERIFKGFDYNGNRRYREHNIDNVLSDMRGRLKEGEGFNYGVGNIRAKHAKKFGSLDAIRKDKGRLTGDMKADKDAFSDRLTDLLDEMRPYYKFDQNGFGYMDDASSMLAEIASKGWRALDEGFKDLPKETRVAISDFLTDLKNAPTEYFETKINRNVGLNEFEAALVPTGTQPRVIEALKKAGLKIVEYDKNKPNARTDAIRELDAQRGPDDNLLFQPAWHGSPHIFDKFKWSDETRGKGEGAQAFGDGLYFAGKKEVAQYYRDTLSKPENLRPDEKAIADHQAEWDALVAQNRALNETPYIMQTAEQRRQGEAINAKMDDLHTKMLEETKARNPNPGRLYKVDIPDDSELLSWDAPLSEQPLAIQEKMATFGFEPRQPSQWKPREGDIDRPIIVDQYGSEIVQNEDGTYSTFGFGADGRSQRIARGEPLTLAQAKAKIAEFNDRQSPTGEQMYRELAGRDASKMSREQLNDWYEKEVGYRPDQDNGSPLPIDELRDMVRGVMGLSGGDAGASEALRKVGIPGHRFLDGGSRNKGDGTYNYVIYDDSRVNIADYEQGEGGPRGSIQFDPTGGASLINLFEKADASTALHEAGHQFLHMFRRFASAADAPEALTKDWSAAKAWWEKNAEAVAKDAGQGVKAADVRKVLRDNSTGDRMKDLAIDRGLHEQWARAFEVYLREGKAPNAAMKGVFEQFRDWLQQVYKSITGMGVNVSPDIKGVFDRMLGGEGVKLLDEAAAGRFKAATAATREIKETFGAKPVNSIMRRPGNTLPFNMTPEAVTTHLFKPGPEGAANIQAAMKAGAPKDAIEAAAVLSAKRSAGKDGALDPAKFDAWRSKHADALRVMPEIDRRFTDAAAATKAMTEMGQRRAAALDGVRRSAIGKLLGVEAPSDVSNAIGTMLGRPDAVKAMRELAAGAAKDADAMEGLRRAVVEHMLARLKTPKDALRADTYMRFLGKNTPALREVLTPEQITNLRAIALDLKRASKDVRAPGGGSDTAENLAAQKKYVHESPTIAQSIIMQMLGSSATHLAANFVTPGVGSAMTWVAQTLGGTVLQRMREAGINKVDALIREAVLNPELMKALLMKAPKKPNRGSALTLAQKLGNIAAMNLALTAGQGEEEEPRAVRRRAEDTGYTPMAGVRG